MKSLVSIFANSNFLMYFSLDDICAYESACIAVSSSKLISTVVLSIHSPGNLLLPFPFAIDKIQYLFFKLLQLYNFLHHILLLQSQMLLNMYQNPVAFLLHPLEILYKSTLLLPFPFVFDKLHVITFVRVAGSKLLRLQVLPFSLIDWLDGKTYSSK